MRNIYSCITLFASFPGALNISVLPNLFSVPFYNNYDDNDNNYDKNNINNNNDKDINNNDNYHNQNNDNDDKNDIDNDNNKKVANAYLHGRTPSYCRKGTNNVTNKEQRRNKRLENE